MFDSLKSKLRNVFKKAPAEIAEPAAVPEPQVEQKPQTVQEQTPAPQLTRKEQKKLEKKAAKEASKADEPVLSDGFFAKKIKEESLDDLLWELEIALLEADVALPVVEEIKEGVKENLLLFLLHAYFANLSAGVTNHTASMVVSPSFSSW